MVVLFPSGFLCQDTSADVAGPGSGPGADHTASELARRDVAVVAGRCVLGAADGQLAEHRLSAFVAHFALAVRLRQQIGFGQFSILNL